MRTQLRWYGKFFYSPSRISSWLKWYKTIKKNRLRLAKVIVKIKMSRFYGSLCIIGAKFYMPRQNETLGTLLLLDFTVVWNSQRRSIKLTCVDGIYAVRHAAGQPQQSQYEITDNISTRHPAWGKRIFTWATKGAVIFSVTSSKINGF